MVCILVDPEANTLRLALRAAKPDVRWERVVPAVIDVGEGGRLLGVEVAVGGDAGAAVSGEGSEAVGTIEVDAIAGTWYVALDSDSGGQVRSASASARLVHDARGIVEIVIPRRAVGYEIVHPSGNR